MGLCSKCGYPVEVWNCMQCVKEDLNMEQLKYFSMFTGVGGFEIGIQRAYDSFRNRDPRTPQEGDGGSASLEQGVEAAISDSLSMRRASGDLGAGEPGEVLDPAKGKGEEQGGAEGGCPSTFNKQLGIQQPTCAGFSEVDKYASAVLKYRYPNVKNYGDCQKINWAEVPDFDLLVGGSPCQDFSIAGKRAGLDGNRSGLFTEFLRALQEKQPKHFVWENVKGTLSSRSGWDFANIQMAFSEAGYTFWWQILNATDFNIPQNRERIFIVGTRSDLGSPREVFFEAGVCREASSVQQEEQGEGKRIPGEVPQAEGSDVNAESGGRSEGRSRGCLKEITKGVSDAQRIYDPSGPAKSLKALGGGMGAKTGMYACLTPDRLEKRQNGRRFKDDDEPMFTLTAQDRHGVAIDGEMFIIRRLMPIECERLMSWPDGWTEFGRGNKPCSVCKGVSSILCSGPCRGTGTEAVAISDSQRYRQCGNGVVSKVVEEVVKAHIL